VKLSSSGTLAVHLVSSRIQRCFIDKFEALLVGRLQEPRPSTRFGWREPQPLGNEDFDRAQVHSGKGHTFEACERRAPALERIDAPARQSFESGL
jgi:hypothetical protein